MLLRIRRGAQPLLPLHLPVAGARILQLSASLSGIEGIGILENPVVEAAE